MTDNEKLLEMKLARMRHEMVELNRKVLELARENQSHKKCQYVFNHLSQFLTTEINQALSRVDQIKVETVE